MKYNIIHKMRSGVMMLLTLFTLHFSLFTLSSCSDMIETDSTMQAFDYELDEKTDSIFFAFGILQAMQQVADQYVFQGEMRGELVSTTDYTLNSLRQLQNFSATTENAYDSAYVYYRVINNCNYYIAHRDTTLITGSTRVVMNEYAAVKAIRAWAYLQLARNYGSVPFFTEPLTTISQINNSNYPQLDINGIVNALAPDLEQYSGRPVPNYGTVAIGTTNFGQAKNMSTPLCFIPVDVILGELYLEVGNYAKAATYLTNYLCKADEKAYSMGATINQNFWNQHDNFIQPSDWGGSMAYNNTYGSIFSNNSVLDIISYIPMSVNRTRGTVTKVPEAFGYNYYALSNSADELWDEKMQLVPSQTYLNMAENSHYYYYQQVPGAPAQQFANYAVLGDMRAENGQALRMTTEIENNETETHTWVRKYMSGNIILYRGTTIWLHLAEALNRLGYPDAAFMILKEGINERSMDSTAVYVSNKTRTLLRETYPIMGDEYASQFTSSYNYGIHSHGAGVTSDGNYPGRSPYQMPAIVGKKLAELAQTNAELQTRFTAGTTTMEDTINAMEDILCDEYAMEFAFEGTRYYDLMRLARHKNHAGIYGGNYGSTWLADKLKGNNPQKDLTNPSNWYLPFK